MTKEEHIKEMREYLERDNSKLHELLEKHACEDVETMYELSNGKKYSHKSTRPKHIEIFIKEKDHKFGTFGHYCNVPIEVNSNLPVKVQEILKEYNECYKDYNVDGMESHIWLNKEMEKINFFFYDLTRDWGSSFGYIEVTDEEKENIYKDLES